eukprot:contig_17296_g4216
MSSQRWLEWLEEDVFPKIRGQVPVIYRASYHLVRTPKTRPARTEMRTTELADSLVAHDAVFDEWRGTWQTSKTKAELMAQAAKNRPVQRLLVQGLSRDFGVSIIISPVDHPELNHIELVWGTVKMASKRGNINFTLPTLEALVAEHFDKISPEEWLKYELHGIKT